MASWLSGGMVMEAGLKVNPVTVPDTKIVSDSSLTESWATVRLKVTGEEVVFPAVMVAEPGEAAVKSEEEAVPGKTVSGMTRSRPKELVAPEGRETVTETVWGEDFSAAVV